MKKLVLVFAGVFASATMASSALATAVPSTTLQKCSDQIQLNTLKYTGAVQKEVRLSIKNNMKGKDSKCSGGFACAGGGNNGGKCDVLNGNVDCPSGQCTVNAAKGIASKINKAKGKLRDKIAQFCTSADLLALYGVNGTTRCEDPDDIDNGLDADELADCILQGAIGDALNSRFGDPAGEVMGRGAPEIVPDSPAPFEVCFVTLGSILSIGSESDPGVPAEAGGASPLNIDSCLAGVCQTSGQGVIGNNLTAPTQTFAGVIPVCLVTVTGDSGNGTSADGEIDLNTGRADNFSPISSTVLIGTTCPVCTAGVCDSGPNIGAACTSAGGTDTACPPTVAGVPPVIPNPFALSTETATLSVPANNPGGGVTNPSGTFCGACDLDDTIGCQNDQDCIDEGLCSGVLGSGCCVFGTNTGAFSNDAATSAQAEGLRSQYVPRLGTIFCTGKSGSGLVDSTQGLPGPVRSVQQQLNAFQY
jgi:hypothetical protein